MKWTMNYHGHEIQFSIVNTLQNDYRSLLDILIIHKKAKQVKSLLPDIWSKTSSIRELNIFKYFSFKY